MSQHTPEPWTFSDGAKKHSLDIQAPEVGDTVATAWGRDVTGFANARLIAAAPELLEALKACLAEYDGRAWTDPACGGPSADARAAIRKAEGAS